MFSRPVIALGADFTGEPVIETDMNPFIFDMETDDVPTPSGKVRWVTTSIARFDPDTEWPTDIEFTVRVNPTLQSYDGLTVQLVDEEADDENDATSLAPAAPTAVASQSYRTQHLQLWGNAAVSSPHALELNDGRWDAFFQYEDNDGDWQTAFECPPDGQVWLQWPRPVLLDSIKEAITIEAVQRSSRDEPAEIDWDVAACPQSVPPGITLRPGSTGESEPGMAACVIVTPSGLEASAIYDLTVPAGTRYSSASGPLSQDFTVRIGGLRPFVFPFYSRSRWNGVQTYVSYRRVRMWLPHSLDPSLVEEDGSIPALAAAMTVSESDATAMNIDEEDVHEQAVPEELRDWSVRLVDAATIEVTGPFQPGRRYTVSFTESTAVTDGYGQMLQRHSGVFETTNVYPIFESARSNDYANQGIASFLAPRDDAVTTWTTLSRGGGTQEYYLNRDGPATVTVSYLAPTASSSDLLAAIKHRFRRYTQGDAEEDSVPGFPSITKTAPRDWDVSPVEVDLAALAGSEADADGQSEARGVFLKTSRTNRNSAQTEFISLTNLCAAFSTDDAEMLVWVTWCDPSAAGASVENSGAVSGANVNIYAHAWRTYSSASEPYVIASGVTGEDGTLVLDLSRYFDESNGRYQLTAIVQDADNTDIMVQPNLPTPVATPEPFLRGSLITDRKVYRIGDSVAVKGFVRMEEPASRTQTIPDMPRAGYQLRVRWGRRGGAGNDFGADSPTGGYGDNAGGQSPGFGGRRLDAFAEPGGDYYTSGEPNDGDAPVVTVDVAMDSYAGSFSAVLDVPGDATYGPVSIELVTNAEQEGSWTGSVASTGIVVSDPRLPTVTLEVSAIDSHVQTGDDAVLNLLVSTQSYLGGPIAGSEVELTWTYSHVPSRTRRAASDDAPPNGGGGDDVGIFRGNQQPASVAVESTESGTMTVTTGADGTLQYSLELHDLLETPAKDGDFVSVTAVWISPTRERLSESARVDVADSELDIAIVAYPAQPLPGHAFDVSVDAFSRSGGGGASDASVDVRLWNWDGESELAVLNIEGLGEVVAPEGATAPTLPTCTVLDDSSSRTPIAPRCRLAMEDVGQHLIVASTTDADGNIAYSARAVGRSLEWWNSHPLTTLEDVSFLLDSTTYAQGETATLSFNNPFEGASLLAWLGSPASAFGEDARSPPAREVQIIELSAAAGYEEVELPITEACSVRCGLTVMLVAPPQSVDAALPVAVPVSALLDVTAPRSVVAGMEINVRATSSGSGTPLLLGDAAALSVSVELAEDVAEPGDDVAVDLLVTNSAGEPVEDAEVTIMVVDRSILDVLPLPLSAVDPHPMLAPAAGGSISGGTRDSRAGFASSAAYAHSTETVTRRVTADPWVTPSMSCTWPLLPSRWCTAFDQTDDEFFANIFSQLTRFPAVVTTPSDDGGDADGPAPTAGGGADGGAVEDGAEAPSFEDAPDENGAERDFDGGDDAGGNGEAAAVQVDLARSEFSMRPLFVATLRTDQQGRVGTSVSLPDNVGTFVVRAIAASVSRGNHLSADGSTSHFGAAETELVVRRSVSLQPSLPRVARIGDRFLAGVVANVFGTDSPVELLVEVTIDSAVAALALHDEDPASRSVTVSPGSPVEVRFRFVAAQTAIDEAGLTFTVSVADGDASTMVDAVVHILPVRGVYNPVTVATSSAITASESGVVDAAEGIALPKALLGVGFVEVAAGVGHLPAIGSISSGLVPLPDKRRYLSVSEVLAALAPSAAMEMYGVEDVALREVADDSAEVALDLLPSFTSGSRGLVWRSDYVSSCSDCYDVSLNAFGLFVAARTAEAETTVVPLSLRGAWEDGIRNGLTYWARRARSWNGQFSDFHSLSRAYLALGPHASVTSDQSVRSDLSMDRLLHVADPNSDAGSSYWISAGTRAATVLSFALHLTERDSDGELQWSSAVTDAEKTMLNNMLWSLINGVRVQGRTAYLTYDSSSASAWPLSMEEQALALWALAIAPSAYRTHPVLPKLAYFVAAGGALGWGNGGNPQEATLAMFALAAYDDSRGSTAPNVKLEVTSGDVELLEARWTSEGTDGGDNTQEESTPLALVSNRVDWKDLASPPEDMLFRAIGSGEIFVGALLRFVPAETFLNPMYRGIHVEKTVRRVDPASGRAVGEPLQVIETGQVVMVTIQVTTPDRLQNVRLVDLAPSGLEPIDPNVDDSMNNGDDGCGSPQWGRRWWWWGCYRPFGVRETLADRVQFFSEYLWPGTHSVSYLAVSVTEGVFRMPASYAFVEQQPEVMGLSAAGHFLVTAEPVAPEDVPALLEQEGVAAIDPLEPPTPCDVECSGNQLCDLRTGRCVGSPLSPQFMDPDEGEPVDVDDDGNSVGDADGQVDGEGLPGAASRSAVSSVAAVAAAALVAAMALQN